MAIVYNDLTVSLTKPNDNLIVEMVRADSGRGLRIFVSDDVITSNSSNVDESLHAILWTKKPSGLMVSIGSTSVSRFENSNAYEIEFSDTEAFQNILAELGICECQVTLESGGTFVTTFDFKIKVVDNLAAQESLESTEEYKSMMELIAKVNAYKNELENYVAQFKDQLKLKVNVRYGTSDPVVQDGDKAGDIYIKYEE